MKQPKGWIEAARSQLSEAFSVTESPPWPEQRSEFEPFEPIPIFMEPDSMDSFGPERAEPRELAELDEELGEGGVEAVALYLSFHRPLTGSKWGVFLFEDPMWLLRERISRDFHVRPGFADFLAQDLILSHELYHFRLDLYALHQELTVKRPLYVKYSDTVYRSVACTPECYEESLANRSAVDKARKLAAHKRMNYINLGRPGNNDWHFYVEEFCKSQPPGYRDFRRPYSKLKERLGGQLFYTASYESLPQPQAQWVGTCPGRQPMCPIYLVRRTPASQRGIRLVVKTGGSLWVIHRYDSDPFPSRPHAHNKETGAKVHLGTGDLYDRHNRGPIGKVTSADIEAIRNDVSGKWPGVMLPDRPL